MDIFLTGVFASIAYIAFKTELPKKFQALNIARAVAGFIFTYLSVWTLGGSGIAYNDVGTCTHVRSAFGKEYSKCDLGWFLTGWGQTTTFPQFITIANGDLEKAKSNAVEDRYVIRMKDNWAARISQITRFKLPQDPALFSKLAHQYPSPEILTEVLLRPTVNASLDSVSGKYSMEEYYAQNKRDDFNSEFYRILKTGIRSTQAGAAIDPTRGTGLQQQEDASAKPIITPHAYKEYGISISTSLLHSFRPNSTYSAQMKERKAAATKRTIVIQKRMAEEQELRLSKARQEIEVTNKSTAALIEQSKKTAIAEADKAIALIASERNLETAQMAIKIAELDHKRAIIESETRKLTAGARAYEQKAMLSSEEELDKKLNVYLETNRVWAAAFAKRAGIAQSSGAIPTDIQGEAKALMDVLHSSEVDELGIDRTLITHGAE